MSDFLKMVGSSIRRIRKERGYTQEELAEIANIHYSYISGIERADRNISLETLEKIIVALKIAPIEIFMFDSETSDHSNEKNLVIDSLTSHLLTRSIEEIKLIDRIAKDMFSTYDTIE